ncbi:MAG: hypothetical protein JRN15_20025, partial [Nitrososphaerota archaeon]|nr:hypothetical protein [Nitrososphaerota archaeon]
YKYHPSTRDLNVRYKNAITGESEILPLKVYSGAVRVLQSVTLPRAYAVPENLSEILQILDRHAFISSPSKTSRAERVESYPLMTWKCGNRRLR